jgi:hypothetical protein
MPSLIYIARIRSLSAELAQSLRSAGCHVQSFKPGDITQDECLLAMTPEAADTALHPERVASQGRQYAGMPARALSQQLGSDTAILDSLKAAVANEIHVNREPVPPAASRFETEAAAFAVPSADAAPRAVSSGQEKASRPIARIASPPITAPSSPGGPREAKKSRLAIEQCYRILGNPLSTVVAVLVLALVYRGLPLMTASPGRTAGRSTSRSAVSVETSPRTLQRVQRHESLDGFVAEDFTNHRGLHAAGDATQQNADLKHPQRGSIPKRIVVD